MSNTEMNEGVTDETPRDGDERSIAVETLKRVVKRP